MHWALEHNLAEALAALAHAQRAGADLALLPELALCGFHRRMPESLQAERLAEAEGRLRGACAELGVGLVYGAPTLAGARPLNSLVFVDAAGRERGRQHKRGLTPSEATLFAPGDGRAWIELAGWPCSAVLCREVDDTIELPAVAGPKLIFWPSYIGAQDLPGYLPGAKRWAREHEAWLLQCNWPVSLNEPATRGLGGSLLIAPDGVVRATLPEDEIGWALLSLPDGGCVWHG